MNRSQHMDKFMLHMRHAPVLIGSWSQCVRKNERRLSMNRPFGVTALAGPERLKAGLQTSGVPTDRFMVPLPAKNRKGAAHEPMNLTAAESSRMCYTKQRR